MISRGFRSQTCVQVTSLLLIVWSLTNARTGSTETVEIVTPENTRIATTETTPPNTTPSKKNLTVDWTGNDSYLQAYREVHKLQGMSKRNDPTVLQERPAKKRQDHSYDTLIRSSYVPDDKYPSLTHHQHWVSAHPHSPPFSYGSFSHPPMHYHEDTPTRTCHGMPYSSPSTSFLSLLPKKLTLKLLLKIILKLVLFKMLVKFIAVICLLLFIPLLNSKETKPEDDGDEKRKARQLDMISNLIWDSISEKNSAYGQDDEMDDIERIAEEADEEPSNSGSFSQLRVSGAERIKLTANRCQYKWESAKICEACSLQVQETAAHFLFQCPIYDPLRTAYLETYIEKGATPLQNFFTLLEGSPDPERVRRVHLYLAQALNSCWTNEPKVLRRFSPWCLRTDVIADCLFAERLYSYCYP